MRLSAIVASMFLLLGNTALGQDVLGPWQIFPGPNPEIENLLPDVDPESAFRIGQIIFDYPTDSALKGEAPVTELSDLPPVAAIAKDLDDDPALMALVNQQFSVPRRFFFEQATVARHGDAGFLWSVTYHIFPKEGGFSGAPYQYRTMAGRQGKLIPPRLTMFDAYFHSIGDGWTCSTLSLSASPVKPEAMLSEDEIRDRAVKHLETFYGSLPKELQSLQKRMQYRSQKQVRIPYATNAPGAIVYHDLRAVNFVDSARKSRQDEVLTVWATPDGRLATLRHLDSRLAND